MPESAIIIFQFLSMSMLWMLGYVSLVEIMFISFWLHQWYFSA